MHTYMYSTVLFWCTGNFVPVPRRESVSCLCVNWPQERALSGSADRSIQQLGVVSQQGLIGGGWVVTP